MSHGSSSDKCDPNLIPLLDLVLQLVMFFMVCANFVMEQINESIRLPTAVAAKPIERKEDYTIFLNVAKDGRVFLSPLDVIDKNPLENPAVVRSYMKQRAEEDYRGTGNDRSKPPRSLIVLRVDKEAAFVRAPGSDNPGVYEIMKACREAGYERVQLRAYVPVAGAPQ